jgi:hypothetical protein
MAGGLMCCFIALPGLHESARADEYPPFAELVGVKLGATRPAAIDALRQYNSGFTFEDAKVSFKDAGTSVELPAVVARRRITPKAGIEVFRLTISRGPDAGRVLAVERALEFDPGTGPALSQIVTDLQAKYGPPSGSYGGLEQMKTRPSDVLLHWGFDSTGKALDELPCGDKQWVAEIRRPNERRNAPVQLTWNEWMESSPDRACHLLIFYRLMTESPKSPLLRRLNAYLIDQKATLEAAANQKKLDETERQRQREEQDRKARDRAPRIRL